MGPRAPSVPSFPDLPPLQTPAPPTTALQLLLRARERGRPCLKMPCLLLSRPLLQRSATRFLFCTLLRVERSVVWVWWDPCPFVPPQQERLLQQ